LRRFQQIEVFDVDVHRLLSGCWSFCRLGSSRLIGSKGGSAKLTHAMDIFLQLFFSSFVAFLNLT
jgi:hypothetical protein